MLHQTVADVMWAGKLVRGGSPGTTFSLMRRSMQDFHNRSTWWRLRNWKGWGQASSVIQLSAHFQARFIFQHANLNKGP